LDQANRLGLGRSPIVALLAIFLVLLPVFVVIERRMGKSALIPPDVRAQHEFSRRPAWPS